MLGNTRSICHPGQKTGSRAAATEGSWQPSRPKGTVETQARNRTGPSLLFTILLRETTTYRYTPPRPDGVRIDARSRFSRRFMSVKNVLSTRAFRSSVRCSPLVATRASFSPCSVMNRMISRCRSCGVFPSAVSRLISAQLASNESVKCRTQSFCSSNAAGTSCLHPEMWQSSIINQKR